MTTTKEDSVGKIGTFFLGVYLILGAVSMVYLLIIFWPENGPTDQDIFMLVILAGAIGSFVHTATSFSDYVGNERLVSSWVWWYILRPFIGASLALIFYFVIRGGLFSTGSTNEDLSLPGMIALAALTGMFSKQAADKLREIFDNLFRTEQKVERADKLTNS